MSAHRGREASEAEVRAIEVEIQGVASRLAKPRVHLRIEKPEQRPGQFHVVTKDKLIAVAEDGTEVDLSSCVVEWREISKVGEARCIEVVLLGFHVTEEDGSLVYESVAVPA